MGSKAGIVNLNDGQPLDPKEYLSERWRLIRIWRIEPGAAEELVADDAEHALYVLRGEGVARTSTQTIELEPRIALTLPNGSAATFEAGSSTLEIFHASLEV